MPHLRPTRSTLPPGSDHFERTVSAYKSVADSRPEFTERFDLFRSLIDEAWEERPDSDPAVALDLGCGAGHLTVYLASKGFVTLAVDGSEAMLAATRARLEDEGQRVAGLLKRELPLACVGDVGSPESVDLIVISSVLEYIEDDVRLLKQCGSLLRPGGTAVVSVPNANSWYWRALAAARAARFSSGRDVSQQEHTYTLERVHEMATSADLHVVEARLFAMPFQRLLPRSWASRRPDLATMMLVKLSRPPGE